MKFSLERKYKVLGAVGQIAVLVITVAAGVFISVTSWWAGLILFGSAALVGWTLIRVPQISVRYDSNALTVVGVLWSRRIPRHSITAVDRDPDNPMVWWSAPGGKRRFTPLTPLWNLAYVPLSARSMEARRRYLTRVAAWIRS